MARRCGCWSSREPYVNSQGSDGATALLWIAQADDLETADALLKAGAKVAAPNALGITPAYVAAEHGNAAMLRRLLDAGASVTTTDSAGGHAADGCGSRGKSGCGATPPRSGRAGQRGGTQYAHTALMWAVRGDDVPIMKLLISKGATINAATRIGGKPSRGRQAPAAARMVSASSAAVCRRRASSSRHRAA
jgi:ankyrin repeat protein